MRAPIAFSPQELVEDASVASQTGTARFNARVEGDGDATRSPGQPSTALAPSARACQRQRSRPRHRSQSASTLPAAIVDGRANHKRTSSTGTDAFAGEFI